MGEEHCRVSPRGSGWSWTCEPLAKIIGTHHHGPLHIWFNTLSSQHEAADPSPHQHFSVSAHSQQELHIAGAGCESGAEGREVLLTPPQWCFWNPGKTDNAASGIWNELFLSIQRKTLLRNVVASTCMVSVAFSDNCQVLTFSALRWVFLGALAPACVLMLSL